MTRPVLLQHAVHQAQTQHKAGRISQAIESYRRILKSLPSHVEVNAQLGSLLLQQGQAEASLICLNRARVAQPNVLSHWVRQLSALQACGKEAQAHELLNSASALKLSAVELAQLRQSLSAPPVKRQTSLVQLYQKGNHLNTEIAAHLFIKDYPAHPLGWQMLGAVAHDSGQLDKALDIRQQTTKQFPNDANAYNNLAQTLLAMGRHRAAAVSAKRALRLAPQLLTAKHNEAQALAGQAGEFHPKLFTD